MRKLLFIILIVFILISCKSKPEVIEVVPEPIEEIEIEEEIVIVIKEPIFEVVSIIILQADIVVTEFEAVLRVENPNEFAMELSSISYELYGNGAYWANGISRDIMRIQALSTSETRFRFSMNFIDMSRRLLDDVIAMRRVNYRFKGQAQVRPDLPNISAFLVDFDCSGLSDVSRR